MTETKIYVGLNDATTKHQVHLTELYVMSQKAVISMKTAIMYRRRRLSFR